MITKQRVKGEQIKRKQTYSESFVKMFKFQENKFKIVQKKFLGNNNEKDFLENHQLQWSLHNKYRQSKTKDCQ